MRIADMISALSRIEAIDADIDETVNDPFPPIWQVQVVDCRDEGGFAFLMSPQSFAAALRVIADIGGADSPKGPQLVLEVK